MTDQQAKHFNILKRNRKYFAAELGGVHKCKIVIDTNSEALELGPQELLVEDVSVRSKYGVDLIFKLAAEATKQAASGICTLKHFKFNRWLVDACRHLGGRWDSGSNAWVFSDLVEAEVEALDVKYNSELVPVEITAVGDVDGEQGPIMFLGYDIAKASGRDSGAYLADDVYQVSGSINSGGSMKNWRTKATEESVFRLQVPEGLLDQVDERYWAVKRLD